MANYRCEIHLATPNCLYVWDGAAFVLPTGDNGKRYKSIAMARKTAIAINEAPKKRHPATEDGKYQAVAIDLDAPQPEPAAPVAQEPEIKHYLPSNGTEGYAFTSRWCDRCERDIDENCEILARSLIGDQPDEWQHQNGKPVCTAWEKRVSKKPEPVTTTFTPIRSRQASQVAKSWSAEMATESIANALQPATTDYPNSTPKTRYRGYSYWVAGDAGDGKKCSWWYFVAIEDEDGKTVRTIQSETPFASVVPAGQAARAAIDRLSAVHLEVHA